MKLLAERIKPGFVPLILESPGCCNCETRPYGVAKGEGDHQSTSQNFGFVKKQSYFYQKICKLLVQK